MKLGHNGAMVQASGSYVCADRMVSFFYELMRGHMPLGTVEEIVRNVLAEDPEVHYCNGWLAEYAAYIVRRFREKEKNTIKELRAALKPLAAGEDISAADVIKAREVLEG